LQIEFLEFCQFTYHFLSEAGRSDAAGAEQEKAKNALKRPISSRSRNGEKWGWWGGWTGSFLWILILSIVWLFQGRTLPRLAGVVLFLVALALIVYFAPWRHPSTKYWKLMLPLFLCLAAGVVLAVKAFIVPPGEHYGPWYSWLWLSVMFLPVFQMANKTWDPQGRT
jgi:hypothetical protein